MNSTLFSKDYCQWVQETVELLEQRNFQNIDLDNLIQEIEDLALNEKRVIETNLIVLLEFLLKWQYQSELQCGGWQGSIREHRRRILKSLKDSPSLRPYLETIWLECYQEARLQAADETGLTLEAFPEYCSFSMENVLNPDYLPPKD